MFVILAHNWWMLCLRGILPLVFGLLIIVISRAGVLAVVWWIGMYAIFFGAVFISLALSLRRWVAGWSELRGAQ